MTASDYLSPEMQDVLARLASAAIGVNRYELSFPEARQALEAQRSWWNDVNPDLPRIETFTIEAAGSTFRARLYDPREGAATSTDTRPVCVYLHGGGWCVGSIDTHDRITRLLALASGLRVLSLDYPLAPEAPFPLALDALVELVSAPPTDPRIGEATGWIISGDSAGANLAVAAALRLRKAGLPAPVALLLFYGCYQKDFALDSYVRFGGGDFGLSLAAMRMYWEAYAANGGEEEELYPLYADLAGLPPSLVVAAECDVLYDENIMMHEKLRAAGVDAELVVVPQVIHGFLSYGRTLPAADATLSEAGAWLAAKVSEPA
ncbi:alpha/beta hydrolase [Acuticoccus mangrovi]|uniref:Alpha/beta hydrolase n=1 Tax=Acuticoccus mangrovi TaxID=2796142 RepID=A0A934IUQ9_9HYPH|nr:alpha/beta hydrolase [Acuticoccus mangrovi]